MDSATLRVFGGKSEGILVRPEFSGEWHPLKTNMDPVSRHSSQRIGSSEGQPHMPFRGYLEFVLRSKCWDVRV